MSVDTAFAAPELVVLTLLLSLMGGLFGVLRPEFVRALAARYHPETATLFADAAAHRRFIRFCGWALLALATGLALATLMARS